MLRALPIEARRVLQEFSQQNLQHDKRTVINNEAMWQQHIAYSQLLQKQAQRNSTTKSDKNQAGATNNAPIVPVFNYDAGKLIVLYT